MPDRLIREGLKTSARVGALSERAEMIFVRLLLTACPLGRYHAEPGLVKSGTLPNRPRIRLTDVALALDEIERAGLIARWTEPDGATFLQVPRFGQRLRYDARSPYPAPPKGTPDVDGQDVMAFAMDREPPWRPPLVPAPEQKEEKRSEVKCAREARHTHDAFGFVSELQSRWPRHDIPECLAGALRHVRKKRGPSAIVTFGWFEKHWMPNAEERKQETGHRRQETIPAEPDGWQTKVIQIKGDAKWVDAMKSAITLGWRGMPDQWRATILRKLDSAA